MLGVEQLRDLAAHVAAAQHVQHVELRERVAVFIGERHSLVELQNVADGPGRLLRGHAGDADAVDVGHAGETVLLQHVGREGRHREEDRQDQQRAKESEPAGRAPAFFLRLGFPTGFPFQIVISGGRKFVFQIAFPVVLLGAGIDLLLFPFVIPRGLARRGHMLATGSCHG